LNLSVGLLVKMLVVVWGMGRAKGKHRIAWVSGRFQAVPHGGQQDAWSQPNCKQYLHTGSETAEREKGNHKGGTRVTPWPLQGAAPIAPTGLQW
jgi:hypothetical protein